jgi:hypothetical protein
MVLIRNKKNIFKPFNVGLRIQNENRILQTANNNFIFDVIDEIKRSFKRKIDMEFFDSESKEQKKTKSEEESNSFFGL